MQVSHISIRSVFLQPLKKMSSVPYSSFWNGYLYTQASRIIFYEFWGFQISVKGSFFGVQAPAAVCFRTIRQEAEQCSSASLFIRIDAAARGMHLKNKLECSKNISSKNDSHLFGLPAVSSQKAVSHLLLIYVLSNLREQFLKFGYGGFSGPS